MAFSYEKKQGPQHAHLAAIIKDTSYYLNGSIAVMQRLVRDFKPMIRGHSSIGGGIVSCVIFSRDLSSKNGRRVYDPLDSKIFVSKDIKSLQVFQRRESCVIISRRIQI